MDVCRLTVEILLLYSWGLYLELKKVTIDKCTDPAIGPIEVFRP